MTTSVLPPEDFYCAQLALENGEPLVGTAVSAPVWVLLEYRQIWQAEATRDNTLPITVKTWLDEQVRRVKGRLQFIRQTPYQERYRFFIAIPDAQTPRLYRFDFAEYEELPTINLAALVNGSAQYTPYLTNEPLFLICTNGKRDRCCAKFGTALYKAFSAEMKTAVWQTTHIEGHRFAPTLISFPAGVCYGHVTKNDIPALLSAQQQGDLFLPRLRGRTVYDTATQAAEYYLCQKLGESGLTTFQHLLTRSSQEKDWSVQFQHNETNHIYQVDITEDRSKPVYPSCGSFATKSPPVYHLQQISKIARGS